MLASLSAYCPPDSADWLVHRKREDFIDFPEVVQASPNAYTQLESKNKCPLC